MERNKTITLFFSRFLTAVSTQLSSPSVLGTVLEWPLRRPLSPLAVSGEIPLANSVEATLYSRSGQRTLRLFFFFFFFFLSLFLFLLDSEERVRDHRTRRFRCAAPLLLSQPWQSVDVTRRIHETDFQLAVAGFGRVEMHDITSERYRVDVRAAIRVAAVDVARTAPGAEVHFGAAPRVDALEITVGVLFFPRHSSSGHFDAVSGIPHHHFFAVHRVHAFVPLRVPLQHQGGDDDDERQRAKEEQEQQRSSSESYPEQALLDERCAPALLAYCGTGRYARCCCRN